MIRTTPSSCAHLQCCFQSLLSYPSRAGTHIRKRGLATPHTSHPGFQALGLGVPPWVGPRAPPGGWEVQSQQTIPGSRSLPPTSPPLLPLGAGSAAAPPFPGPTPLVPTPGADTPACDTPCSSTPWRLSATRSPRKARQPHLLLHVWLGLQSAPVCCGESAPRVFLPAGSPALPALRPHQRPHSRQARRSGAGDHACLCAGAPTGPHLCPGGGG